MDGEFYKKKYSLLKSIFETSGYFTSIIIRLHKLLYFYENMKMSN